MPRAQRLAALALVALVAAAGVARGQEALDDEPLRRLDPDTLAGGDYGGTEPQPLAGGTYGREPQAAPRAGVEEPLATQLQIGDPLAGSRAGLGAPPRAPRARRLADEPYSPTGVRAGAFILRPTLESTAGYDTNPNEVKSGGKGSAYGRLRGDLDAVSDWSRHQLEVRLSGQIRKFTNAPEIGLEPQASATVDGRIDVTDDTQIVTQLRASITTSSPGDPETENDVDGDEIQKSYGATLGVAKRFNRFSLQLDGLVDRYLYDDSKLLDGSELDNSDRIYNAYEVRLRGAYELSPRLQPFAEIAVDTRDYDKREDDAGKTLGSSGYALRAGAKFEATRLITGELALGYGRQTPKENSLDPVEGLLIDGSIAWVPTALTTVRLNARSALQETNLTGASGVLTRSVGVAVEHALRRNVLLTARATVERLNYKGIGRVDDALTLALEGEYRLNRSLSLIGSFQHEKLASSESGEGYSSSIIEVGLRLRR
ncbi:outer membrane beta-barrel protein [Methylopila sp. 73B]|uniref:outer membrane beta-barrel protein n=1 Tax=Methylopila sp. 73B TaxID=1120792 RepID=UPI000363AC17|nr:outer membrane beta-barrel protein [Methylopila sp. 73B]